MIDNLVKIQYEYGHFYIGEFMSLFYCIISTMLLGCSEKQTDTAAEDVGTIEPTLGDWKFSALAYSQDACFFDLSELYSVAAFESNVYTLTEVSETQAKYVDLYGITFDCAREGNVVTCPSTFTFAFETYNDENGDPVVDEEGNPVAPDATNTITTEFVTTFSAPDQGTLSATLTASCEGQDCEGIYSQAGVTENPCTSLLSGSTSLQ